MSAFAPLHRSARFFLLPLAVAALSLTACGSDSVTGAPLGTNGSGTPTVGGVCVPATATNVCVGQDVLACTPAGTWIVEATCGMGQKCQQSAAMATCVAAGADASGGQDAVSGSDAAVGTDAATGVDAAEFDATDLDATVDDTTAGTDAIQATDTPVVSTNCTTYQDVQAIFANNCNGCHGHTFGNGCTSAANYPQIAQYVSAGVMPPGGGLGAADKATVAAWAAGKNTCTPNQCPGADAGTTQPDAGTLDTIVDDTVGPGPDTIGPGPDTVGPGPDTIGPGPDTVGPGPDAISPGPTPATCGNLKCDTGENANNCPIDCGTFNTCVLSNCQNQANACVNSTSCRGTLECEQKCATGDTACINACLAGKSNKTKTNLNNLETCIKNANCSAGPSTCGNGVCDAGETTANCPGDCPPPPPVCGNGVCEAPAETTANCPGDCPAKTCTTYADVQAISQNNCNGCHGHAFGNGCSSASNYASINSYVQSGSMPQGGSLSAADKATIAAWAAAKNACTTATCP